jgi:hypothetical protein
MANRNPEGKKKKNVLHFYIKSIDNYRDIV